MSLILPWWLRCATPWEMVSAAAQAASQAQVRWIPETIHDIGYHKPQELAQVILEFLEEK